MGLLPLQKQATRNPDAEARWAKRKAGLGWGGSFTRCGASFLHNGWELNRAALKRTGMANVFVKTFPKCHRFSD